MKTNPKSQASSRAKLSEAGLEPATSGVTGRESDRTAEDARGQMRTIALLTAGF